MSTPASVLTVVRVLGVAVTVTAVLLGAVGVANSFARSTQTESFAVTEVTTVRVRVDVGRVRVERAAGRAVEVSVRAEGTWRTPRTERHQDGGTLTLRGHCGEHVLLGGCGVSYTVAVPDGVDVDVAAAAGAVHVEGVDGQVSAHVDVGRLDLTSLRSPRVRASSDVGPVRVTFAEVPDRVAATTATGEVTVVVPPRGAPYAVQASTDTGTTRVDVATDAGSPRTVVARSDVGDVTVTGG